MALAITLDRKLYGKKPFALSRSQKALQILFNAAGYAIGMVCLRMAPARFANALTAHFTHLKSKRTPPALDAASRVNIEKVSALSRRARDSLKKEPAVFFITSHPETSNEEAYRLGDLIYHTVQTSGQCFPNKYLMVMQAIDPFALDTLPGWLGGLYAGLVHSGFIAVDRMPGSGTWAQNLFFRKAHVREAIFNILRGLKSGNPVCAAVGGGVIHNTRILYVFREFAQRIYFESLKSLSKRECEARVEAILHDDDFSAAVQGRLASVQAGKLKELMAEVGVSRESAERLLSEFAEELALGTPYRVRFMHVLIRRICGMGIPLLMVPLMDRPSGAICVKEPVLISAYDRRKDELRFYTLKEGIAGEEATGLIGFVKKFVREELNEYGA